MHTGICKEWDDIVKCFEDACQGTNLSPEKNYAYGYWKEGDKEMGIIGLTCYHNNPLGCWMWYWWDIEFEEGKGIKKSEIYSSLNKSIKEELKNFDRKPKKYYIIDAKAKFIERPVSLEDKEKNNEWLKEDLEGFSRKIEDLYLKECKKESKLNLFDELD